MMHRHGTKLDIDALVSEQLFYAASFERSLSLAQAPNSTTRLWCLIELERYEEARRLAKAIIKQNPAHGEGLALLALSSESGKTSMNQLWEMNEAAIALGSATGQLNLARLATVKKDYALAKKLLMGISPKHLDVRQKMFKELLTLQAVALAGRARQADILAQQVRRSLATMTIYQTIWSLLFLSKHAFTSGDRRSARATLSQVESITDGMPPCRFQRTLINMKVAVRDQSPSLDIGLSGTFAPGRTKFGTDGMPDLVAQKPVLAAMYACIVKAGEHGISKAEMASAIWDIKYDPARDDARLYKSLGRLRNIISKLSGTCQRIVTVGDRYILMDRSPT